MKQINFNQAYTDTELHAAFEQHIAHDTFYNLINPSYIQGDGYEVFCFRALSEDRKKYEAHITIKIGTEYSHTNLGKLADPKLTKLGDEVWMTYHSGNLKHNTLSARRILPTLDEPIELMYEGRQDIEKNWALYKDGGKVYALYSLKPLTILKRTNTADGKWVFSRDYKEEGEANTDVHIGSNLVKHGQGYYLMANVIGARGALQRYYTGALAYFDPQKKQVLLSQDRWVHSLDSLIGTGMARNPFVFSVSFYSGLQIADRVQFIYGLNDNSYGFSGHGLELLGLERFKAIGIPANPYEQDKRKRLQRHNEQQKKFREGRQVEVVKEAKECSGCKRKKESSGRK